MGDHYDWRSRAKRALEAYFEQRSFPRLILSAVLLLTGVGGFAFSFVMLHLGVNHMWIRYPIAVLGGYGILLALIRLWVACEQSRCDLEEVTISAGDANDRPFTTHFAPRRTSWLDWLDIPDPGAIDFGLDEGCLGAIIAVVIVAAVLAVLISLASIIAMAPGLIMEVFLDAFIVTALFRRLRVAQKEHWLGTALRKTWAPAIITAAALALSGYGFEQMAPGAPSIGKAIQQIQGGGN